MASETNIIIPTVLSLENISEKELHSRTFDALSAYFNVESEVWSDCRKGRIDMVMTHKSDIAMRYPIGIEVKKFNHKTGSDIAKWIQQAQSYSDMTWGAYGKILVIVAPQMSGYVFSEGTMTNANHVDKQGRPVPHHNFSTFLGQFRIGEMQTYYWEDYPTGKLSKRMRIVCKGWTLWDQSYDDIRTAHYDRICKK